MTNMIDKNTKDYGMNAQSDFDKRIGAYQALVPVRIGTNKPTWRARLGYFYEDTAPLRHALRRAAHIAVISAGVLAILNAGAAIAWDKAANNPKTARAMFSILVSALPECAAEDDWNCTFMATGQTEQGDPMPIQYVYVRFGLAGSINERVLPDPAKTWWGV